MRAEARVGAFGLATLVLAGGVCRADDGPTTSTRVYDYETNAFAQCPGDPKGPHSDAGGQSSAASASGTSYRDDGYGPLPDGTTGQILTPVAVSSDATSDVVFGGSHSFGVLASANANSSLSDGTASQSEASVSVLDTLVVSIGHGEGSGHFNLTDHGNLKGHCDGELSLSFVYHDAKGRVLDPGKTGGGTDGSVAVRDGLNVDSFQTPELTVGDTIDFRMSAGVSAYADNNNQHSMADYSHTFFLQFVPDTPGLSVMDGDGDDFSASYVPEPAAGGMLLTGVTLLRRRPRGRR